VPLLGLRHVTRGAHGPSKRHHRPIISAVVPLSNIIYVDNSQSVSSIAGGEYRSCPEEYVEGFPPVDPRETASASLGTSPVQLTPRALQSDPPSPYFPFANDFFQNVDTSQSLAYNQATQHSLVAIPYTSVID